MTYFVEDQSLEIKDKNEDKCTLSIQFSNSDYMTYHFANFSDVWLTGRYALYWYGYHMIPADKKVWR